MEKLRGVVLGWILGAGLVGASADLAAQPVLPITVANYQIGHTDPHGEMVEYFNHKFGVDLTFLNFDNQYFHEQLDRTIASGVVPDWLYLREASTLGTYVKLGILAPLPPAVLGRSAPRLYDLLTKVAPEYLAMGKVDGTLYGIPVISPTNLFHVPLVYREDWMHRVGVDRPPRTLDEFQDLMYRFARQHPDGDGKNDTYGLSRDGFNAVFGAFGVVPMDEKTEYWLRENGRLVNCSVSPRAKQALGYLARWYHDGVIDPEAISGENHGGYWAISHAFVSGRIGFTTHGNFYHWTTTGAYQIPGPGGQQIPAEPGANGRELELRNPGARVVLGPPLTGPTGTRGIKAYNRLMNFVTFSRAAAQIPGKLEKMLQMLDANASDDPKERLGMHLGIEGRHWKLLDPQTDALVILPPWDKDDGYWSRIGCGLSIDVPLPPRSPRDQWAYRLGLDQDGIESLIQCALPSSAQYEPALRQLRNQAYWAIITGKQPLASFDAFVQEYEAAGGAVLQREAQQYWESHR